MKKLFVLAYCVYLVLLISSCKSLNIKNAAKTTKIAAKPLFRDTIYDGAADPTVIWNDVEKRWFMFYTNRRANKISSNIKDVSWVHGTPIGIAESADNGATWTYRADAKINYGNDSTTFWAPEVVEDNGTYHMYLTIVPGIFSDWQHPRYIIHLTSKDLLEWDFESKLKLANEKVIDACVLKLKDGTWRLWYNNEIDKKSIYYADSRDLQTWEDKGKIVRDGGKSAEGPNVFFWKEKYFMIVDEWRGLGVYSSTDAVNWKYQNERILDIPGTGPEDNVIGQHPCIVVNNSRAYIFYFTHPGRSNPGNSSYEQARSLIQVAELEYADSVIKCNRNKPVFINLTKPQSSK